MPRGVFLKSAAHRAALSSAQRGKTLSPSHLAKIRAINATRRGKPLSVEHRAAISAAGVGREVSPETRTKLGMTKQGPANQQWKGDAIGYRARHARLPVITGRACVDCGVPACNWSLRRNAHGPLVAEIAGPPRGLLYSIGPDSDYEPRCRPHHMIYDRGDVCRRGHALTEENSYRRPDTGQRSCRICNRERGARHDKVRRVRTEEDD